MKFAAALRRLSSPPAGGPWRAISLLAICFSFLCPAVARADIVVLLSGQRLEGRVVEEGDTVTVYTAYCVVTLKKARIREIIRKKTSLEEYEEQASALLARIDKEGAALDAQESAQLWFDLAEWCGTVKLARPREEALQRAIAADPGHEAARTALGYALVNGQWLKGAARQQALGLVLYKDKWVSPEARDDAERAAAQTRQENAERARQDLDLRLKQAEANRLDAERNLLEEKARTAEAERQRAAAQALPPAPPVWYYGYNPRFDPRYYSNNSVPVYTGISGFPFLYYTYSTTSTSTPLTMATPPATSTPLSSPNGQFSPLGGVLKGGGSTLPRAP